MKVKNISILIFTLGISLIILSILWINSELKFEFSNLLVVLFGFLIFNLGFSVLPFKKPYQSRKKWALVYLIIGLSILALAGFLKFFHISGVALSLIEGTFFLCCAYLPLLLKNRFEKWLNFTENKKLLLFLCLGDLLSISLILTGSLFQYQMWPGALILLISGLISLATTLIGWNQVIKILVRKRKEAEENVKAAYKEITDSIIYAKRIQSAKLPDIKEVKKIFPESFIIFKPKDIVSGDFYYLYQKNSIDFIAAADCTGHGVPGAFMSLIGFEKLDEAMSQYSDVSEILTLLNNGIKKSLNQNESDESTRDGMDIALCGIDRKNSKLMFSGANRPLWIIKNETNQLEEIKATKKAIGGFSEQNQKFDTTEVQLNKGDTFYIFSDGYTDTFGGPNAKKVTTKKFKEILLTIQHLSMHEQEKYLIDFIENWRGKLEQIDDILVIGVRI